MEHARVIVRFVSFEAAPINHRDHGGSSAERETEFEPETTASTNEARSSGEA